METNYHIAIAKPGHRFETIYSHPACRGRAFESIRDMALDMYRTLREDEAIEITSAGLTVWGPFVKGSTKFIPTGA
jgi:hypothetical protein